MRLRIQTVAALPAALVAAILTLALAPPADAASSYAQVGWFGNAHSPESASQGEFHVPQRIAVAPPGAPGEGDIYVADTGNHRIEVFAPAAPGPCGSACATFLTEFGASELSKPVGVAVDPESGAVYVMDAGLEKVVKYDRTTVSPPTFSRDAAFTSPPSGAGAGQVGCFGSPTSLIFISQVHIGGIAVDPTVDPTAGGHDILIVDPCKSPGEIERFTSTGSFVEEWDGASSGEAFHEPADLALNAAGEVIVADLDKLSGAVRFLRFSDTGVYQAPPLEPVPNPYPGDFGAVVGVDTATGEIFASSATEEFPPGQVYRFDSTNSPIDHFGAEGQAFDWDFGAIASASTSPDRLYVLAWGTFEEEADVPRIQVFESSAYPEATIEAVESADVTPASTAGVAGTAAYEAVFHGAANPSGGTLTACRFEYATQAQYEKSGYAAAGQAVCQPSAAEIGRRDEVVDVQAKASDLQPNVVYHLRLLTSNGGLNGEAEAATFTTPAPAPAIETQRAWSVTDGGATLTAAVDPNNAEVGECFFEYGETTAYGHTAPCQPVAPGAGHAFVQVLAAVEGLSAPAAYHFRLVAANTCAQGCGAQRGEDATFTTRPLVVFPERHYELVSLLDDNGIWAVPLEASADGEHYAYTSEVLPFPGAEKGAFSPFRASRVVHADGTVGWEQQYVGAPHPAPGETEELAPGPPLFSAGNLSHVAQSTREGIDPADDNHVADSYLYDAEDGSFTWLSCTPTPPSSACPPPAGSLPQTEAAEAGEVDYVSPDGSRVLFTSARHLLPADVQNVNLGESLYEWDEGRLSLVGVRPGSSEGFTEGSALGSYWPASGNVTVYGNPVMRDAVSSDGRRVVFESESGSEHLEERRLYVRIDGESTIEASAPAAGAPPLTGACQVTEGGSKLPVPCDVNYWGADEEDESVYFTSTSPLTKDSNAPGTPATLNGATGASADLYRYLVPTDGDPAGGQLVDLTPESLHPSEAGAGVTQVLWVSSDGLRVYFEARAALTPGAQLAPHCDEKIGESGGACNLYLAEVGAAGEAAKLTLIASGQIPLGGSSGNGTVGEGGGSYQEYDRQVSGNAQGSVLAFRSAEALVPGRQTGGRQQVYVYETARGELSCASCTPDGSPPPASWAGLTPAEESGGVFGSVGGVNEKASHVRNVATDGAVFFQTASSLLPADANGVMDVYEWRGGLLRLISDAGPSPSIYGGAAADGSTVFVDSGEQLLRGVEGGARRIYAARVGPPPPETLPTPPCAGEDCKPEAIAAPQALTPGSFGLVGPGNRASPTAPKSTTVKPKAKPSTRARKLAKTLNACSKKPEKRRATCARRARRRYRAIRKAARRGALRSKSKRSRR